MESRIGYIFRYMEEREMFHLDEVSVVPAEVSAISSRSEIHTRRTIKMEQGTVFQRLPIFVAPMASVLNEDNYSSFESEGLNVVIPRSVSLEKRLKLCKGRFTAFSLQEFEEHFVNISKEKISAFSGIVGHIPKVCVDVANGHMQKLLDLCKKAQQVWDMNIRLMAGNIANPDTITHYVDAGINYVRVGIGGGGACTTSVQTGVHVPMGSLLLETVKRRNEYKGPHSIEIVADGGFSRIDQVIKALALGADYVMLGKTFAMTFEACGDVYEGPQGLGQMWGWEEIAPFMFKEEQYYREYYGMSTERAQSQISKGKTVKNSEGLITWVPIMYPVADWVQNFEAALKSAMSYAGCFTLSSFASEAKLRRISPIAFQAYTAGKNSDNLSRLNSN